MRSFIASAALLVSVAAIAQAQQQQPGASSSTSSSGAPVDITSLQSGRYTVDAGHSLVNWTVSHLGITPYTGEFGNVSGELNLDKANPSASRVDVRIPINSVSVVSDGLAKHLMTADFFDIAKYPEARFTSTSVVADPARQTAQITGQLTMHGVTRPVVLDTRLYGAGNNPMNKKASVGFEATARIQRSQWGISTGVPGVGDAVDLRIIGAFERA